MGPSGDGATRGIATNDEPTSIQSTLALRRIMPPTCKIPDYAYSPILACAPTLGSELSRRSVLNSTQARRQALPRAITLPTMAIRSFRREIHVRRGQGTTAAAP